MPGLPLIVDPNFALVYNKRLFLEAGLDPDAPPQTIEQLDQIFSRLLRYGPEGELTQFPIIPWDVYGITNTMLTWGWAFGGQFIDNETGAITAHHPNNVRALEWVHRYYEQYYSDLESLMARAGVGDSAIDLFLNEQLAMFPTHSGGAGEIAAARPDIDLGIAVMPHISDGGMSPTWIGGWALAIPVGAPNPELAWQFMKALTATPEGTGAFATDASWFTGYIPSPSWDEFIGDPVLGPYVDIVLNAQNARPSIPAYQYFDRQIEEAVLDLLERREFSAREVLERASRRVEEETLRILQSD